jgi:hypothetical protein
MDTDGEGSDSNTEREEIIIIKDNYKIISICCVAVFILSAIYYLDPVSCDAPRA